MPRRMLRHLGDRDVAAGSHAIGSFDEAAYAGDTRRISLAMDSDEAPHENFYLAIDGCDRWFLSD